GGWGGGGNGAEGAGLGAVRRRDGRRDALLRHPPQPGRHLRQDRPRGAGEGLGGVRRPRLGAGGDAREAVAARTRRTQAAFREQAEPGQMDTLRSFVQDRWVEGREPFATLVNPSTEEPLARTSTGGIDMGAVVEHARAHGASLREATFAQRGELLKAWSNALHA